MAMATTSKVMMTTVSILTDDDKENDVNLAAESFLFTEVNSSIDLLTKQFEKFLLNTNVQISLLKKEYKSL